MQNISPQYNQKKLVSNETTAGHDSRLPEPLLLTVQQRKEQLTHFPSGKIETKPV